MNPGAFQKLWQSVRPFALPAWLALFTILCLIGLNPYFRPDYHDNITYYIAAESILAGEGYTFQGAPIADWPPVTSLVLAAVFSIFGSSIFVAKLVSIAAAVATILLANRLLHREGRPDRLKSIALFTLTPVALLTATTIASDWICAAFSFGCLLTLSHLREKRHISLAIGVGLLLGLAALTRQTGVLLGAAITFQAVLIWRKSGFRHMLPEFIAAAIGASMYLGWGAYTAAQLAKHPPLTGNYVNQGIGLFTNYSITDLSNAIFDLFWKWDDVLERFGVPESVANGLLFIPLLILVIGLVSIIRSGKTQPSDVYTLAFLALLLGYNWKMSRYLLPITPFLIAWFFAGLRSLRGYWKRAKNPSIRERDLVIPAFAAVWLAFLIPLDAYALFNRTGNGAHRGISAFRNPLPSDYYQGRWADLYAGCEAIKQDGQPGAVAGAGFYRRYIRAFSGRNATDAKRAPDVPVTYAIFVADESRDDPSEIARPGDTKIFERDSVTVFRRSAAPRSPELSTR